MLRATEYDDLSVHELVDGGAQADLVGRMREHRQIGGERGRKIARRSCGEESPQIIRIRWYSEPISGLDTWIPGAPMSVVTPTVRLTKPFGCML
jgi:hypothetical protein